MNQRRKKIMQFVAACSFVNSNKNSCIPEDNTHIFIQLIFMKHFRDEKSSKCSAFAKMEEIRDTDIK